MIMTILILIIGKDLNIAIIDGLAQLQDENIYYSDMYTWEKRWRVFFEVEPLIAGVNILYAFIIHFSVLYLLIFDNLSLRF